jgi:hypothetical protein
MANALFVCLHNAGRSQMSQALFERAAEGRHAGRSAGTTPGERDSGREAKQGRRQRGGARAEQEHRPRPEAGGEGGAASGQEENRCLGHGCGARRWRLSPG